MLWPARATVPAWVWGTGRDRLLKEERTMSSTRPCHLFRLAPRGFEGHSGAAWGTAVPGRRCWDLQGPCCPGDRA